MLIAYDRDEAGESAAEKLAGRLMAEGIDCYRIAVPEGDGCERVRAESGTACEELRRGDPQGAVAGRGAAKPVTTVPAGLELERRPQAARPTLEGEEARAREGSDRRDGG